MQTSVIQSKMFIGIINLRNTKCQYQPAGIGYSEVGPWY